MLRSHIIIPISGLLMFHFLFFLFVKGRMIGLQRSLIFGSCECVNFHGKRNFADVIGIKDLVWGGRLSWII